ncbi:MAG: ATP-binding protein [Bacteroidota bacterium]|nr:ATP-binding protein [Bacteroidota bacterium]
MRFVLCFSAYFLSGLVNNAVAQNNLSDSFSLQNIEIENGLPSNNITNIIKDSDGFIWIGTDKGLCRWDGVTAQVYTSDEKDSLSISGNHIPRNSLVCDNKSKRLFIGTENGLSIYYPEKKQFVNYLTNSNKPNSLQGNIYVIYLDRQDELWIGTKTALFLFDEKNNNFRAFTFADKITPVPLINTASIDIVYNIAQDVNNDQYLWIATLGGLIEFNKYDKTSKWYYFSETSEIENLNLFTEIVAHSNGNLYIGTWNVDMLVFNTVTKQFEAHFGPLATNKNFYPSQIIPSRQKSLSELWVTSRQGLGIFNTVNDSIQFVKVFQNSEGHKFKNELFFVDNANILWIGSIYGVFILKPKMNFFDSYFLETSDEEHWYLSTQIFENDKENLLIGYMRGDGLHFFDRKTKKTDVIPYTKRSINENNIYDILKTADGKVYFLSSDEIYNLKSDNKTTLALNARWDYYPAFTDFAEDSRGNIWVSSKNFGLQKFNVENGILENVVNWKAFYNKTDDIPNFAEIIIDKNDRIWFRRRIGFYGFYNPHNNEVKYFDQITAAFNLQCFTEPVDDTLWVSTASGGVGVINLDTPAKGLNIIYPSEKLISNYVQDIVVGRKGNLWLLTEKGIEKIDRKKDKTALFNQSYGLPIHDKWFNRSSLVPGVLKQLSEGTIAIGYRRGIGFFHPDSLRVAYHTPEPYISSISLPDKIIYQNSEIKDKQLKLNYDENYFSINYSAYELYNSDGLVLQHKLEGIDIDWAETENHKASYSNLRQGEYGFIVRAIGTSGYGLTKTISLKIIIKPPWWKTWWALIFYVLSAVVLLYLILNYRFKRRMAIREAQRLLELDALKTKLYANITHEFRTPLTVIMGVAEGIGDDLNSSEKIKIKDKLETIGRNSHNLLHLVNQLLDLAKLESGKLNFNPVFANIIPWLGYFVESHQSLVATKNIQLTFYSEMDAFEMDYDPQQLSKVISNLLSNAVKFTEANGKVIVHVKSEQSDNSLLIKVKDNGIGIPKSELNRIFDRFYQAEAIEKLNQPGTGIGLSLSKEIVELCGGSISVKSLQGKGSEFDILLPVTRKAPKTSMENQGFSKIWVDTNYPNYNFDEEEKELSDQKEKPLVLIAEDNPDVAAYISDTIRKQYRIKWVLDGGKALQKAFEIIPDIIITDIMMPGIDGYELCNTLKLDQRTDHIPVIMLTAKVTETDRITGYEKGADAYLSKPFNKKELLIRIAQLLKLRKQLQAKFSKLEIKSNTAQDVSPEEQFIRKAIGIIENNLEKTDFSAGSLAIEIHLSESQLYRKLKAVSGKSTAVFIRTVRLKKACQLITETPDLSISEIAYQCGFNNPAWFSRAFKDEYGVSPTEYKR